MEFTTVADMWEDVAMLTAWGGDMARRPGQRVSAANPHLLRFSQICPRLTTLWSFSLLRRNRRLAAQSQDQTYIFLICRI